MEEIKQQLSYTLILHQIRKKLGLSLMEYCIADSIYHLSNNPKNKVQGWCYASKETLADFIGTTQRTVFSNINHLIIKGLIEKDEETSYLRTTPKWYENVVLIRISGEYKGIADTMKKLHSKAEKSVKKLHTDSEETSYNNNIDNKIKEDKDINSDFVKIASSPLKRKDFKVPAEDYKELTDAYEKYKGIKLQGAEFGEVKRAIKTMLYSGRTKQDIINFMKWAYDVCQQIAQGDLKTEKKLGWMSGWTILTCKRKLPEFLAGKLQEVEEIEVPEYARQ